MMEVYIVMRSGVVINTRLPLDTPMQNLTAAVYGDVEAIEIVAVRH